MRITQPADIGAPPKFTSWRKGQYTAIMDAVASDKRFVVHAASTGSGKSLTGIANALMTGARTAYLTATKGLQSQAIADFRSIGLTDVRGQSAYQCIAAPDFGLEGDLMVSEAPCQSGLNCSLRHTTCLYYAAVRAAQNAQLVVTNYAFWQSCYKYGDGLGAFDLLILDEAHQCLDEISKHLAVELTPLSLHPLPVKLPRYQKLKDWQRWAAQTREQAQLRSDHLGSMVREIKEAGDKLDAHSLKEIRSLKRLVRSLQEIEAAEGEWVCEIEKQGVKITPVEPSLYAEGCLFRKVPRVVLMSATVTRKTMDVLGVDDYCWVEQPSLFPVKNRPVYHIPTVGLSYQSTPEDLRKWLIRIDQIIDGRLDRKGIIHAVSYKRCEYIMKHSRHRKLLLTHGKHNTRSTVERFKNAPAPAVLVSPALTTGWDFEGESAEYCIIAKMPYPDLSSALIQARKAKDPGYIDYLVAQVIIQMAGRIVRSETERGETLIIDDVWEVFLSRNRHLFPKWFLAACTSTQVIPPPLPKGTTTHKVS